MDHELLEVADPINDFDGNYKVQYIKLIDIPFNLSDNPAEPFFIKAALDYDKQQLPVLRFQEFDLLFRSLKSSSNFKRYLFWKKAANPKIMWTLWILSFCLTLLISKEPIITLCIFGPLYLLIFGSIWYTGHVMRNLSIELQDYCQAMEHEEATVQLFSTDSYRMKLFTHFEVRSKAIEEDSKRMKIYSKFGGEQLIMRGAVEIFKKSDFLFEQPLLGKFLAFGELQQKIRVFKQDHTHKACMLWRRVRFILYYLVLSLYCIIFLVDNTPIPFILSIVVLILIVIVLRKESKCKSKMLQSLRIFCENVRFEDQRVQVIAHIRENPRKKWCLPVEDQLYCFEIRKHDLIQS